MSFVLQNKEIKMAYEKKTQEVKPELSREGNRSALSILLDKESNRKGLSGVLEFSATIFNSGVGVAFLTSSITKFVGDHLMMMTTDYYNPYNPRVLGEFFTGVGGAGLGVYFLVDGIKRCYDIFKRDDNQ